MYHFILFFCSSSKAVCTIPVHIFIFRPVRFSLHLEFELDYFVLTLIEVCDDQSHNLLSFMILVYCTCNAPPFPADVGGNLIALEILHK